MIDLHCHVLPAVDDGPATVDAAIRLAREARADGITTIAATPHVDAAHPATTSRRIQAAVRELQERLEVARVDISLVPGAEVASTRAAELGDAELRELTLGGAGCLLLECPLDLTLAPGFTDVARRLARRGHRVLLAHPERCPIFLRSPLLLDELVAEGILAQVTAGALSGRYGRKVREVAVAFVERGVAHVLASDGHGEHRPARIASELRVMDLDPVLVAWLTRDVPAALLAGGDLPARPTTRPRGRLMHLRGRKRRRKFTDRLPAQGGIS